jgi:hypothetical protein
MPAITVLEVIVTGVCALVPSASDRNLTRVVCPNATHMHMVADGHAIVPEHVTFLEIPACSFVNKGREPDFTHRRSGEDYDRHVFVLQSEEITLATPNMNTTAERNELVPVDLSKPGLGEARYSTIYEIDMAKVCPDCGPIDDDFFDLATHPHRTAARMDLRGGRERTSKATLYGRTWRVPGTALKQPFAQEIVYELDLPQDTTQQTLHLRRYSTTGPQDDPSLLSQIGLAPATTGISGCPMEVTLGSAPLWDLLVAKKIHRHLRRDHHFDLVYELYEVPPEKRPLPEIVPDQVDVLQGGGDCIPPRFPPQDPQTVSQ